MIVVVVGAGAVGGYFGAALAASGREVVFVARGANLEVLRARGLRVTGTREIDVPHVDATDRFEGRADLALLAVKSYDVADAATAVSGRCDRALTLQNGVDAPGHARAVLGDIVIAGTTNIVADLAEPGHVEVVSSYARIRAGADLRDLLEVPGIEVRHEADVDVALWEKTAHMCGMAGLTTLARSTIGALLADPHGRATYERIVREAEAVARASGVRLPQEFAASCMAWAAEVPPEATSSMLRDLLRGRRLEIDALNGAVVRLGRERGVPTPVNEAVYAAVRLLAKG